MVSLITNFVLNLLNYNNFPVKIEQQNNFLSFLGTNGAVIKLSNVGREGLNAQ